MDIHTVGVVGCGQMGTGIAQVCAQSGYQVIVSDINNEIVSKGLKSIKSRLNKNVEKGQITLGDMDAVISRIKGTTDYADFSHCDVVVEAVTESMDLKKKVFSDLDEAVQTDAVLATNTSVLPVIDIALATKRPENVIGTHFFNPAPVMALLEIVRTIATSNETLSVTKAFGESLNKTIVVATDSPGFIVNHLLKPFLLNAIRMLEKGLATKEDIDNAITLGLNHPIGPLRLCDLIGIDTIYYGACAVYEELKNPQYAPPVLMKRMVSAGWLGRKTGRGFYEY